MSSEVMNQIRQTIDDEVNSKPSAFEFEMAYQARTAIDRIKFAIKHTEQFGARTEQMFEASLQLLDAVERLETLDRRFQERSRLGSRPSHAKPDQDKRTENGRKMNIPHQPVNGSCNGGHDRPTSVG
jgi:hypothetical protein